MIAWIKIKPGELFYYLFWILMLLVKGIGWYDGQPIYNVCFVAAAFFIGMKLLFTEHTTAEWFFIAGLSLLGLAAYFNSDEKGILLAVLTIIGLKGISLRRLFKIGLSVWGVCFAVMNVLGIFDIVTGSVMAHEKNLLGVVLRKSLGYTHPNVLHVSYAVLAAFILYLSAQKKPGKYFLLMLGNIYIFLYSLSYTGLLFVFILLAADGYFTYRTKISNAEQIILRGILPLCLLFSLVGPHTIPQDSFIFRLINAVMNTRFFATKVVMDYTPLSLFGTRLQLDGWALDNSYAYLLLSYGMVLFSLFCLLFGAVARTLLKQHDRKGSALLFSFLIAGVMEPFLANTAFKNLTWPLAGVWIFDTFFHYRLFNGKLLSAKRMVLQKWDRIIALPIFRVAVFTGTGKPLGTRVKTVGAMLIIIAGIGSGLLSYFLWEPPAEIYIDQQKTDLPYETPAYYLDPDRLPPDFQGIIYGYRDPHSPLIRLAGAPLKYEQIRKCIGIGIGLAGMTFLIYAAGTILLKNKGAAHD